MTRSMPLVLRWVNSMRVFRVGPAGVMTPLQRGQWLPHPAPEPEARTNAPQITTATL